MFFDYLFFLEVLFDVCFDVTFLLCSMVNITAQFVFQKQAVACLF